MADKSSTSCAGVLQTKTRLGIDEGGEVWTRVDRVGSVASDGPVALSKMTVSRAESILGQQFQK
jgi:hypothetical protein